MLLYDPSNGGEPLRFSSATDVRSKEKDETELLRKEQERQEQLLRISKQFWKAADAQMKKRSAYEGGYSGLH